MRPALWGCLKRRPDDFGAWFGYGLVLLKVKRETEAESALKRAIALEPENEEACSALCTLYQERGDFAAAAAQLETGLQRRPEWSAGLVAYAHALTRLHRFDEMETVLARAIASFGADQDLAHRQKLEGLEHEAEATLAQRWSEEDGSQSCSSSAASNRSVPRIAGHTDPWSSLL